MARNPRVDVARGMLILYIITIVHGFYWMKIYAGTEKSFVLFEMPCIFFISGYSYALSLKSGIRIDTGKEYFNFLIKRFARILIPYWFYAFACLCLIFLKGDPAQTGSTSAQLTTVFAWLNPLEFGQYRTFSTLNYHLWFIVPFLGVSLLMPLLVKAIGWKPLPVWVLILFGGTIIFMASILPLGTLTKNLITYSFWSFMGYAAGSKRSSAFVSRGQCITIFTIASASLFLTWIFGLTTLDMQSNKFPPNITFFIFSLSWFSLLWFVTSFVKNSTVERLLAAIWFRSFANKGYSIYMWQGLAYTLAQYLGLRFDLPLLLIWILAIILTVCLGIAASPIESFDFSYSTKRRLHIK